MKRNKKKAIKLALGLGAIAGMRATFAPSLASHLLTKKSFRGSLNSGLAFLQLPASNVITKIISAGEIVGDKLPSTPNRTSAPQLITRIISGALVGATIFQAYKQKRSTGLLLGGLSALAMTYASFYARKYFAEGYKIEDTIIGGIEDTIAIGTGARLINS
ncbi:hypothetical protein MYP_3921 [Sporocytophaga myxococcoides]|uniref:DUF4126 domain-containing protein n=1 Tax=Sporocytophaga myxococcoides TaxID=153721 RepID=A0A098LI62_9BACT|nr:DUF4126 family protein [Sporocytophaga myxococcoides]GAL86691.1 hypothetical protein MYP_3921 [Sporocytophaga myxococcoides]